ARFMKIPSAMGISLPQFVPEIIPFLRRNSRARQYPILRGQRDSFRRGFFDTGLASELSSASRGFDLGCLGVDGGPRVLRGRRGSAVMAAGSSRPRQGGRRDNSAWAGLPMPRSTNFSAAKAHAAWAWRLLHGGAKGFDGSAFS